MTYIAVRIDAAQEIIGDRTLQSTDFAAGLDFIKSIQSKQETPFSVRIAMKQTKNGLVVFSNNTTESRYIVFDVDQTGILGPSNDSASSLTMLQKALRFAVKYWQRSVLAPSELVVAATNRGIVFPYPISRQTGIRMVIDLAPDAERLEKRAKSGRYLLVYKVSEDDGGPSETASFATFRKFVEEIEPIQQLSASANTKDDSAAISAFSVTELDELNSAVDPHQSYETWMHLLSTAQKDFVEGPVTQPRRISGPAGTGKTVTLALTAVHSCFEAQIAKSEFNAAFFTHSESSRRSIETIIRSMGGEPFLSEYQKAQRLQVVTLQGYCASLLRQDLSTTEFVDPDAYDAKQLQSMYVEEALKSTVEDLTTYERFMSEEFVAFIKQENVGLKTAMIQHEIGVVIKGRSRESFDVYKRIPRIVAGLPIVNNGDKGFVWRVYQNYREQLVSGGQFDTDDVVLTALGQLSTPIWRRRRARDGFDAIFVDETHLFNMNELSIFHHLTKTDETFPIAFAVDRSQAIGDRGWSDDIDTSSLLPSQSDVTEVRTDLSSIFRSAPEIVNLAFTITSSGASLFTNFEDPLILAHSNMSFEEEKKAQVPTYISSPTDDAMIQRSFDVADEMREGMNASRGAIAIIAFNEDLFARLQRHAAEQNKPVEVLKNRGDEELAARAKTTGRFILSMPEYVGGLEFDGVVLVGVDRGRVPPIDSTELAESRAYVTFAAHNRLYVSISRARYRAVLMGTAERGESPILSAAFGNSSLERT